MPRSGYFVSWFVRSPKSAVFSLVVSAAVRLGFLRNNFIMLRVPGLTDRQASGRLGVARVVVFRFSSFLLERIFTLAARKSNLRIRTHSKA
jgi:hypothetical protein